MGVTSSQEIADDTLEETEVKHPRMASSGEDWRRQKTLTECNLYMLDNQLFTDVKFQVKSTLIHAHRTVLISRSQVFENDLVQRTGSQPIVVNDVEPELFKKMLRYCYSDAVDFEMREAADLLKVAQKYKISGLEGLCVEKLGGTISLETVCTIYNTTEDPSLRFRCFQFILCNAENVIKTNGWFDVSKVYLKAVITNDQFNVKEELIFESLIKWVEKECLRRNKPNDKVNQNEIFKEILPWVRFGLMESKFLKERVKGFLISELYIKVIEDLAEMGDNSLIKKKRSTVMTIAFPEDSNAVSSTQQASSSSQPFNTSRVFDTGQNYSQPVVQSIRPASNRVLHPRPDIPMNVTPAAAAAIPSCNYNALPTVLRHDQYHPERSRLGYFIERDQRIIIERFQSTKSGKAYTRDNKDGISFIASKNLKLHGILVYGSHQRPGEYHIDIRILKDPGRAGAEELQSIWTRRIKMDTDGATKVYEIEVSPPILINKDKVYTLRSLIKGQVSFFGDGGQHTVLKNGLSINFVTDIECLNGTSKDIGQFPGFVFEEV